MNTFQWEKILASKDFPPTKNGHSAHAYKGNMLIFGGEKKYSSDIKIRLCYNDLWQYNVQTAD